MKNIFKKIIMCSFAACCIFACDSDEPNSYEELILKPDANSPYYIQFKDATQSFEIGVAPDGGPVEVMTPITVSLLGLPQNESITVNISVDPSSTISADQYSLASNTITIPAGSTTASTMFTTISENMVAGETVSLILNIDAAGNEAPLGTTLAYDIFKPLPCIPVPGIYTVELVDTYGDGWQTDEALGGGGLQITLDGVVTEVGLCTPYQGNTYACIDDSSMGTATFEILDGTQSAKYFFPGDQYGEIAFEIFAPDGTSIYKRSAAVGGAENLPILYCLE